MRSLSTAIIAAFLFFSSAVYADLVFSAPPREHPGDGGKTYGMLVDRLSEVLGEKVTYQQPASWAEYSNNLRENKYDIIFDGPHFTAWRIKHIGYNAVARLPGHLAFHIITIKSDDRFHNIKELRGTRVCAFASPNLTSSVLLDQFQNDVIFPTIVSVNGNMGDIVKSLQSGKCDAAVVRDQFYTKGMTDEQRKAFSILFTTREFPNQGISVSDRISSEQQQKIASVLENEEAGLKPITQRFAKEAKTFIASKNADYDGISQLLEGVVWGW